MTIGVYIGWFIITTSMPSLKDMVSKITSGAKDARHGYTSLAEFVKERMPDYPNKIYPHQEMWFKHIMEHDNSLILTPRGHFKTTTIAFLIPLYLMYINKNIRILYVRD